MAIETMKVSGWMSDLLCIIALTTRLCRWLVSSQYYVQIRAIYAFSCSLMSHLRYVLAGVPRPSGERFKSSHGACMSSSIHPLVEIWSDYSHYRVRQWTYNISCLPTSKRLELDDGWMMRLLIISYPSGVPDLRLHWASAPFSPVNGFSRILGVSTQKLE